MTASFVGNYPWFFTYNFLNSRIPEQKKEDSFVKYLGRSALIGFTSTAVSDTISNSVRVVKTTTQV